MTPVWDLRVYSRQLCKWFEKTAGQRVDTASRRKPPLTLLRTHCGRTADGAELVCADRLESPASPAHRPSATLPKVLLSAALLRGVCKQSNIV